MFKNYLTVALRNLWKNKTFSGLNLLGLALGMACSLLIMFWVQDERSIDAFHVNKERIFTVYERQYYDGKIEAGYYTPGVLADELKRVMPQVQYACGYAWNNKNTFSVGDKILKKEGNHVGEDFFKMFSYHLLQGTPQSATYQFSDEEYHKLYRSEEVIRKLSRYFAFLGIFISCLGLLGLTMFTAEQKTKEFGIRKVLGAPVLSLFTLLSKDFLLLVTIAFVIASPLAWWAMDNWLQNFVYRTPISIWVFLFAGIMALIIALFTVSFQAIKAAIANPVTALRSE